MAQQKPPKPPGPETPPPQGDFKFTKDSAASKKAGSTCRCGGESFREVHRITQPKGGTSVMYECTQCGEYSI